MPVFNPDTEVLRVLYERYPDERSWRNRVRLLIGLAPIVLSGEPRLGPYRYLKTKRASSNMATSSIRLDEYTAATLAEQYGPSIAERGLLVTWNRLMRAALGLPLVRERNRSETE